MKNFTKEYLDTVSKLCGITLVGFAFGIGFTLSVHLIKEIDELVNLKAMEKMNSQNR